jgi:outer membrane protein
VEDFVKKNVIVAAAAVLLIAIAGAPALAQSTAVSQPPAGQATPFMTTGSRVDLSIEEAVARAREKNIDLGVARITPRLTDFSIAGLEANYRINLTTRLDLSDVAQPATNATQGVAAGTNQVTNTRLWNAGFTQNLYRGGGNYSVAFNNNRREQSSANAFRNPTFNSSFSLNVTQPLLRGFKIDSTRASLRTSRITQQNDEIGVQATMATTIANTRNAYWDLVFAIQAVEAAQNSLDISSKLVQDNQARVEIGTLAPIDIKSAEAEQANRRLTLVTAQSTVRTSELALKRLIVSGTDDPMWASSINPVDRPAATPEPISVEAAVSRALAQRTDVQQSLNNLKVSDINLRLQEDATKPQLNLTLNYGLSGLGGPTTPTFRDPITGETKALPTVPSGYFDAIKGLFGLDVPQWTLSANFAYPLGRSAQEATVARSKLSLEQTQANLKALQLQIATDVANAALTVQSSLEAVQASKKARELAKDRLDAMQSKFEVGMSTNYEVVQAQRDYLEAQNNELRNLLNYRKALVNFETVQTVGTRAVSAVGGGGGL